MAGEIYIFVRFQSIQSITIVRVCDRSVNCKELYAPVVIGALENTKEFFNNDLKKFKLGGNLQASRCSNDKTAKDGRAILRRLN